MLVSAGCALLHLRLIKYCPLAGHPYSVRDSIIGRKKMNKKQTIQVQGRAITVVSVKNDGYPLRAQKSRRDDTYVIMHN